MCKYCEMKPDEVGTMVLRDGWSVQIEQGSIKFNVQLDRTEDGEAFIWTDVSAVLEDEPKSMYLIKHKTTKIQYCPFCGEKLEKTE